MKYLILLILLSGCSIDHRIDPIKVEPITVNHYIKVDPSLLREFYRPICEADLSNNTPDKVLTCINHHVDDFLNALSVSSM